MNRSGSKKERMKEKKGLLHHFRKQQEDLKQAQKEAVNMTAYTKRMAALYVCVCAYTAVIGILMSVQIISILIFLLLLGGECAALFLLRAFEKRKKVNSTGARHHESEQKPDASENAENLYSQEEKKNV